MKTLVVEDEFTSRLVVQRIVSHYGECHIAVNGEEALEAFQCSLDEGDPYDLICMDFHLPGMDGIETVRKIRDLEERFGTFSNRGAKILMATVVDSPREVVQAFHALCDAYFVKPINTNAFTNELRGLGLIA